MPVLFAEGSIRLLRLIKLAENRDAGSSIAIGCHTRSINSSIAGGSSSSNISRISSISRHGRIKFLKTFQDHFEIVKERRNGDTQHFELLGLKVTVGLFSLCVEWVGE
jgi:hypothetical protein